ncbi:IS200/IS605 family transposase, partial [Limosilactobacillus fermentum]|nr:IS200/IS605 family transposase [Limosilactobacillus fermentum]
TLGNMSKEVVEKYINDQKYTETNKKPHTHKGAQ